MPATVRTEGRGVKKVSSVSVASGGLTDTAVALLTGTDDYVDIVDRIYFQYPDDVTSWDMDLNVNGVMEEGIARDVFTIDDSGAAGPTDLRAVFDWDNPNPPTGFIYGYVELSKTILDGSSDSVNVVGNDGGTAANNYTSTGATAMQITVVYRQMSKSAYERNLS